MFSASADLYDLIYAAFKDYRSETAAVAARLRALHPSCRSVLDVACGTGEHARWLAADGFLVDGLDLDPAFIRIAASKHPDGRFVVADMSDFHVGWRYDAILCLFSSIGYLRTLDRVEQAARCFAEHLAPGGVILVEPWFAPGVLDPGRVDTNAAEADGVRVTRTSRVEIEPALCRLYFDYDIVDAGGRRSAHEIHELGLFTAGELTRSLEAGGLVVELDAVGLTGRGLYVARAA